MSRAAFIACYLVIAFGNIQAQTFSEFILSVDRASDSLTTSQLITDYLSHHSIPVVEDSLIHFVYRGDSRLVAVPGEMNWWNPSQGTMKRVRTTNLFFRTDTIPIDGRVEYKLWVDSSWILDPLNSRTAMGGFGANSEVWMPNCKRSIDDEYHSTIAHGNIDTSWIDSKYLQRRYPAFVYTPPGIMNDSRLPVAYITDGGDYLVFGKMNIILDNLIAAHRAAPIIAVFIDPRTILTDPASNMRMSDYAASDAYLDFLEKEVIPYVEQRYPVLHDPDKRLIMGASMGGLIGTYAVLKRPDVIGNCIAQSPAYRQADSAVIKLVERIERPSGRFYLETGTINDTQNEASYVRDELKKKNVRIMYEETHEGHNWTNWRRHLPKMLEYFFPTN
jgi:enterochelin esterase-like enzyme